MPNFKDLSGQKFNRVTAHWPAGIKTSGKIYWLCSCECGTIFTTQGSNVSRGKAKSCGCLQREKAALTGGSRKMPNGESCFNALFRKYGIEASRRNLIFSLSREEFRTLLTSNCHYCGRLPQQVYKTSGTSSQYIYNGVDRIENSKGYDSSNVLPCCKICNFMKMKLSYRDFLDACRAVTTLRGLAA